MKAPLILLKKRKHLGKKCNFSDAGPYVIVDINPDRILRSEYIERSKCDKGTQLSKSWSLHKVNTTSKSTWSTGMDHKMGGWPIEVDPRYEDQVWRYKKKIYKEEDFINSIKNMADLVEMFIKENNSLNIYEDYFEGDVITHHEEAHFKTLSVFRDTCEKPRKVTDISWSLDGSKVAGAYAVDEVVDCRKFYSDCFIWDIDNCNVPYCIINSHTSLRVVEYSPSDLELLAGGCSTGQIGLWDSRIGGKPYYVTNMATSHAEDVTDIKWIYSKNGLVFFSASTDGKIICWDIRNMDYPSLVVDLNEGSNDCSASDRITCLEYNTCLPHRFMMGTIRGKILSCNRKYTQPKEMIAASYSARYSDGPILKIQRNSFLPKVFTSCGTWGVKVWAEDITSSPILNLVPQAGYVTDAAWSNSRSSLLLMTKTTGHIELWDILLARQRPLISFKVATEGLSRLQYKQNSNQIACGTPKGCIHLLEVPEYSTFPSKPEKNLLAAMIEREYKREKLLENMTKEQLLRQSEETENDNMTLSKSADYTRITRQSAITNVYERPINVQEIMDDFVSDFDSYLQDIDGDQEEDEKPFFDFQTVDILKYMSDAGPHLIVDIDPDPELKKQFVQVPTVAKESHCSKDMTCHEVNTDQHETSTTGMNHVVGGWPFDVEYKDKDQVTRFTKRIQKEENFIDSVKMLGEQVEMILMENNSVNIYEEYFSEDLDFRNDETQFKTRNVFRDLCDIKRKVLDLSWSLDGSKITGAYSIDEIHLSTSSSCCECYIWDIENCNVPYCTLLPKASLNVVEYSPRDLELLLGGYGNGQVGLWDARIGGRAQQTTPINVSHKESVSDITWITSKSGLEFVSASRDGKLYCWDSRNMVQPNLSMPLIQNTSSDVCYNITCLEYDSTLPNRLMVGTEEGTVLSCNRKYKDPKEIITGSYPSRCGPVLDISRNVFFPKLFASCSCYGVEVWSEDLTESPMINLKSQKGYVTDAIWCQNHPSFLLVTKSTGHLELWDILIKHHCPVLSVKFETEGLIHLNHKQHSNEVACSTPNGCILLIEVPEFTAFSLKQEKNLMAAMIDREGKRERTIEGITREINAREKHPDQKVDLNNSNLLGSSEEEEEDRFPEEFISNFNSDFPEEDVEDENEETLFDLHFVDNLKKVSEAC